MKSLNNYISEAKKVDSVSLAKEFLNMTLNDNDSESIEDDIEIFLDTIEEELYKKDYKTFDRFRGALVKHVDKY